MSLQPGSRLGSYDVVSLLGAGGMGEVYKARDTRLNRDVAIKILPVAVAADEDRLARFEREAQTLASLNHPNIAQVYGVCIRAAPTSRPPFSRCRRPPSPATWSSSPISLTRSQSSSLSR